MNWVDLLNKAVMAEGSQAAVARKLGFSASLISRVLSNTYTGSITAIKEKTLEIYGGKTVASQQAVPDGYKRNNVGHLVPIETIDEIDLARDEFVQQVAKGAVEMSAKLKQFKRSVADDMQAFFELSAEKYKADVGSSRSFLELTSYDGQYKIIREFSERFDFNERLQVAKSLIDECLHEWSQNSGVELRAIVERAFKVNKKGKINVQQVLSLRSHKFEHPTWLKAMEAINDALIVVGTCTYYRMYERDEHGRYQQIGLDFAGA